MKSIRIYIENKKDEKYEYWCITGLNKKMKFLGTLSNVVLASTKLFELIVVFCLLCNGCAKFIYYILTLINKTNGSISLNTFLNIMSMICTFSLIVALAIVLVLFYLDKSYSLFKMYSDLMKFFLKGVPFVMAILGFVINEEFTMIFIGCIICLFLKILIICWYWNIQYYYEVATGRIRKACFHASKELNNNDQ